MTDNTNKILLLLSGGPDSVYLFWQLLALKKDLKLDFSVLHFNHQLRAQESDQDAAFVKTLCDTNQIECFIENLSFASLTSLQNNARQKRYALALKIAKSQRFTHIATAHHQDDLLETLVMRKSRGSGLKGLCGIASVSKLKNISLWRPLLEKPKVEILDWLKQNNKSFRLDSSNTSLKYFRNRTREILGNSPPSDLWKKHHRFLCFVNQYFEQRIKSLKLTRLPLLPESIFAKLTPELKFRITQILAQKAGYHDQWTLREFSKIKSQKSILHLKDIEIIHDHNGIWFFATDSNEQSYLISQPGSYYFGKSKIKVSIKQTTCKPIDFKNNLSLTSNLEFPLTLVQNVQKSLFLPYGKTLPVDLNEFLKGKMINKWLRKKWPILRNESEQVVAVLGIEIAHNQCVSVQDQTHFTLCSNWIK